MNMLATIVPRSDQLNSDDLIGRTLTITVTKVSVEMAEQPVAIFFEGDNGKPYKPGKSMRRVLVKAWGADAKEYIGRSMTLYRDDAVQFGGLAVGGIRISHMSHINGPLTMALTATRGNKKAFTVKPLAVAKPEPATPKQTPMQWFEARIASLPDRAACFKLLEEGTKAKAALERLSDDDQKSVRALLAARVEDFLTGPQDPPQPEDMDNADEPVDADGAA